MRTWNCSNRNQQQQAAWMLCALRLAHEQGATVLSAKINVKTNGPVLIIHRQSFNILDSYFRILALLGLIMQL